MSKQRGSRPFADVLIAPGNRGERELFEREHFTTNSDGALVCPAGRIMRGPTKAGTGLRYFGVGCADCPLRSRCTTTERRELVLHPALDHARAQGPSPRRSGSVPQAHCDDRARLLQHRVRDELPPQHDPATLLQWWLKCTSRRSLTTSAA